MAAEDLEEAQGMDEGGVGGPGAPTPLWALEVRSYATFSTELLQSDS